MRNFHNVRPVDLEDYRDIEIVREPEPKLNGSGYIRAYRAWDVDAKENAILFIADSDNEQVHPEVLEYSEEHIAIYGLGSLDRGMSQAMAVLKHLSFSDIRDDKSWGNYWDVQETLRLNVIDQLLHC